MQVGILGLPNIGKSTLFNTLTLAHAAVSNYPFCTIKPNVGFVVVSDERLDEIFKLLRGKEKIPAQIKIVDLAGLVKGASHGEGLGNEFLSYVRTADVLIHVVRCFENKEIAHIDLSLDPVRDIEIVDTELILADLKQIEKRLEKVEKQIRTGDTKLKEEKQLLEKLKEALSQGKKLAQLSLSTEETEEIKKYDLLTRKPILYVANVDEEVVPLYDHPFIEAVGNKAKEEKTQVVAICASWEKELAELKESEREEIKQGLGIKGSSLKTLIDEAYRLLNLITFYTAEVGKIQAWPIPEGTMAKQAAGKIHSDMEEGFICAELYKFSDLKEFSSPHALKEKGLIRSEGKTHQIQDGDIIQFRFR